MPIVSAARARQAEHVEVQVRCEHDAAHERRARVRKRRERQPENKTRRRKPTAPTDIRAKLIRIDPSAWTWDVSAGNG